MMKKRLLSTLLALCMALTLLPVTALAAETSGSCGDNLTWSYSNGTLTIQGTGPMDDYTSDGRPLRGPWMDYIDKIQTVEISDGVTSIGDGAFRYCTSLTDITIPNSVTSIGPRAFLNCSSLTSVVIPSGVTSIGDATFFECNGLTSVTIPDSVTTIGASAFLGCVRLTDVDIPNSVTTIDHGAFQDCVSLTSVIIPSNVTRIEMESFAYCSNLASVTIPDSVTRIGPIAFDFCENLTDVYYSGSESQWQQIEISNRNGPLLLANIHYGGASTPNTPDAPSTPSTPSTSSTNAVLSPQKLAVDGKDIDCEKYNIGGSNYFKLRDLAQLLNDTGSQFGVGYDAATSTVTITTGEAYTPAGGELATGVDNSATAQPSSQAILIDGVKHDELTVYNIGGSNFFQLRELGNILGFDVGYDQDSNTAIVRSVQK